MRDEYTAIAEQDGPWYVAYCADALGANGRGVSRENASTICAKRSQLILEHRREKSRRSLPPEVKQELVVVGRRARRCSTTSGAMVGIVRREGKEHAL